MTSVYSLACLLGVVEAHVADLREALEKITATRERNRWHPDTNHPTDLSQRWHDDAEARLARVKALAEAPRCRCGAYPVSPDHCLTLFDRNDTAVERHAVGVCERGDA